MKRTTLRGGRSRAGELIDIAIEEGRIAAILPAAPSSPALPQDGALDGRLVLPLLVNGHAHLDKTFLGASWQPHRSGATVRDRIDMEKHLRAELAETAAMRAELLAHRMIEFGTGTVRAHVDVDTQFGLTGLEDMLALRERLAGLLDMQLVAFPQNGIVTDPGTLDLLEAALRSGADLIGGLDPIGIDGDLDGHLDAVFGLAERWGAGLDIHLHGVGRDAVREYDGILVRTRATGLNGRVTISHGYGLGALDPAEQDRIFDSLAELGVSVMTNGPAGTMPPVRRLRDHGVNVFIGSDNVRDAWWPFGDGDVLDVARNVAYQSDFLRDEDLAIALDGITEGAARALQLDDYGLRVGGRADLLVLDASSVGEALAAPPVGRDVMRGGEWIAQRTVQTRTAFPPPGAPYARRDALLATGSRTTNLEQEKHT